MNSKYSPRTGNHNQQHSDRQFLQCRENPNKYAPRTTDPFLSLFLPGRQRAAVVSQFRTAISANRKGSPSAITTSVYHAAKAQAQEAAGKDAQLHRTLCSLVTHIEKFPHIARICARFLMEGGQA